MPCKRPSRQIGSSRCRRSGTCGKFPEGTFRGGATLLLASHAVHLQVLREGPGVAHALAMRAYRGDQVRHRLSRAGNRQINRVLHIMATVQLRNPTEGRAYFDRKKASGKTSMEAMRALKRRLSDIVFTTMRRDAAQASPQLQQLTRQPREGWVRPSQRRHV